MGRPKGAKTVKPLIKLPEGHDLKRSLIRQANEIAQRIDQYHQGKRVLTTIDLGLAKLIYNKVVPDLANVQHSGDTDNPVTLRTIVTGVPRPERDTK
jgi:hypothetical protein